MNSRDQRPEKNQQKINNDTHLGLQPKRWIFPSHVDLPGFTLEDTFKEVAYGHERCINFATSGSEECMALGSARRWIAVFMHQDLKIDLRQATRWCRFQELYSLRTVVSLVCPCYAEFSLGAALLSHQPPEDLLQADQDYLEKGDPVNAYRHRTSQLRG